jgi:hypothetical protein
MVIKCRVDKKKENVVIQIEEDKRALAHILLDSATTENHIHDLAKHRAALLEQVPTELDPGSRLEALIDPIWHIPNYRREQGRILALRHPGLGWLSFVLTDKEAASIAEWLTKDLPLKK